MKKLLLAGLLTLGMSVSALAEQLTLSWNSNTESDLEGYELHYGESSGNYRINVVMPRELTMYTVGGLQQGKTYYFALKAFDTSGNRSGFSEEVSQLIAVKDVSAPSIPTTIVIPAGSPVEINIGNQ